MKKRLQGFVAGFLVAVILSATVVFAAPIVRELHFAINVVLNGQEIQFDEDSTPFIMEGRTFLPLGAMARLLGLPVEFDPETTTVYVGYKEPSELLLGTWAWADAFVRVLDWEPQFQFLDDGVIRSVEVNTDTGEERNEEYFGWRMEGRNLLITGLLGEDMEANFTIFRDIFGNDEIMRLSLPMFFDEIEIMLIRR